MSLSRPSASKLTALTSTAITSIALLALTAGPAAAVPAPPAPPAETATTTTPPTCEGQVLSQPFTYAKDTNLYSPVPGQTLNDFAGEGWELSGGAQIINTTLSNGTSGQVLNLPSGSKAVSPAFCVTKYDPTARALVRNVVGAEGVFFYVSYEGTKTWTNPKNTGQIHGNHTEWTVVTPVNMQPENTEGSQRVRLTLIPGGKTSDFQVYDLYVDPRMR